MTVNHEIKTQLAKLLATENFVVEHRNVRTASFNVYDRILVLPLWKLASNTIYDLLVAHECSHALFTPNEDWTEKVNIPKQFVNVVEDVRIEKLMKRKYPGLAKTFYNGYRELNDDDFFDIAHEDINTFNLADRINLHFKVGHFVDVAFSTFEEPIVRIVESCETFDDVLFASELLYKFYKKEKEKREDATKDKALDAVQQDINKAYGEGSIMRLGGTATLDVESISTGCLSLDMALGVGGVPKGRIVEIFGPESSGKTTLALHIIAECQKNGGKAAFIDAENALDPEYAQNLGCNADDLLVSQPDSGEQALDILQKLLETAALDVIVIDSVAALVPRKELEGEIGDVTVGLQARLMSQALRKLSGPINKSRTCVVFINQIREKIGVMFGSPETTPGGRALKFYSSVRLDIRRIAAIKEGTDMTGNRTRVKVVKNKVAPPFKMTEFDIMYGKGISYTGDLLDLALQGGVVEKMGSWFSYKGDKIAQGREKVKLLLESDEKLCNSVLSDVKTYLELA